MLDEDKVKTSDHRYDAPELPALIAEAMSTYGRLANILHEIQAATRIPGLHTNINSEDDTPGVLERIQYMHDAEESDDWKNLGLLDIFKTFDEEG
jgi:hypothetical protein